MNGMHPVVNLSPSYITP